MAAVIKDLAKVNAELQEQKERVDNVDFKMVTFSLAGKDYGVDIMNVKEIAKADKFTYVPNAASFVRGVYNLRGDIIPIIDLRTFFHLSVDVKADGWENMLILRIEDRVYGTIVDKIDKVVGINSRTIQPPHPIFGDINIKFISGVVEKQGDLYIILDVVRIFTQGEDEKQKPRTAIQEASGESYFVPPPDVEPVSKQDAGITDSAFGFIKDSLAVHKRFMVSPLNDQWVRKRFAEWAEVHSNSEVQLRNAQDADDFLATFYSPNTGAFWDDDYSLQIKSLLPNLSSNNIQVWNLGCGKGYETFSMACILRSRYPSGHIKIWANDNDILSISTAPNMVFDIGDVPKFIQSFMVRGKNGYSFSQEIKGSILFEYHDILNGNQIPGIDIIIARDFLSFISFQDQEKVVAEFSEKLKKGGLVILGRNEQLPVDDWQPIGKDPVSAFARN
ncbi:MAG: chemotaxis protein CheW [Spirochaetaceae bacterium]|jgi:purine-binding chemotaxis protein CheW|nr:chemotaxis protein CheW [Spirochaetaceae bacterium]